MTIGTPIERFVGTFSAQGATTVVTPTTTVAAGNRAIAMINTVGNTKVASSIVDSVGNTWTVHSTGTGTAGAHSIASCQVTTQITNANTITITWGVATSQAAEVLLWQVSGLATSSSFDQVSGNNQGSGTTSRTSNATPTLSQASELVVGICSQNLGSTMTAGSGFTLASTLLTSFVYAEYQIVNATTGIAAVFNSVNSGASTRTTAATFKAAAVGPASVKTVDGLAIASVKTADNLAIGSVKSFVGVT